ncbi:hypothetical protein AG1IA_06350 [Rhizoctonia solani AG-1 IA]|uniref:Uncharacterized protein n=1 Tax=Thanatephorus cucumeris (strain AG1-IA) TaxID=983506 RepID=L8WNP4_THACA|nr:hypothetical protein AG1IA_06350 [Rhizoctonia solani AG-1 IA]
MHCLLALISYRAWRLMDRAYGTMNQQQSSQNIIDKRRVRLSYALHIHRWIFG